MSGYDYDVAHRQYVDAARRTEMTGDFAHGDREGLAAVFAAGAASRDTEVRELREKLEAAEHERDEHIASHGLMVKQFKIMQAEKEHGWREAEQTEARIARVEALAESLNASDKWHDVAPMIWAAVGGTSTPDERVRVEDVQAAEVTGRIRSWQEVDVELGPDETPEPTARCGFIRTRWDGPYRMDDRCIDKLGHPGSHGPWEWLAYRPGFEREFREAAPAEPMTDTTAPVVPVPPEVQGNGRKPECRCGRRAPMSAEYVRTYYGVPAKRGGRVRFQGKLGTIVSFPGAYVGVRLDGEKRTSKCHPTWEMEYL